MEEHKTRLPHDIWYMVFQELGNIKWKKNDDFTMEKFFGWLPETRLVCKDFNNIVTPWAYRYMRIHLDTKMEKLVDGSKPGCSKLKENIILYCEQLRVSANSKPEFVALTSYLIERCKRVEGLYWFLPDGGRGDPKVLARLISTFICLYLNGASSSKHMVFHLGNDSVSCENNIRSRPNKTSRLLKLPSGSLGTDVQMASYRTKYEDEYNPFSASKPSSTSLHSLTMDSMGGGALGNLVPCGKMIPAMEKLKLMSYIWGTSVDDFPLVWDFSRLRSLSTTMTGFCHFMSHVPLEALNQLQTFKLRNYSLLVRQDGSAVRKSMVALLESCCHLESFKLESPDWEDFVPMDSLAKIGTRLRKLRLIPIEGGEPAPERFLTNGLDDYPNLVDLGLGLDVQNENMYGYLTILARVRVLRELSLFANKGLATKLADASSDPNYDAATKIMKFIHAERRGKPFNMVKIVLHVRKDLRDWRPVDKRPEEDESEDEDYPLSTTRKFMSRINAAGIYEQWGSERTGGFTSESFDSLTENHLGTSDLDEASDAEDSEYVVTDDEEQAVSAASG